MPDPIPWRFTWNAVEVRKRAMARHQRQMSQLDAYFRLLLRLAEKAERRDLFDRIERTLAEIDRRKLAKVRHV